MAHRMKPEIGIRELKNQTSKALEKQKAVESWQQLLEIGRTLTESEPEAKSAVTILTEIREEEIGLKWFDTINENP